jgi:hypothetical protein
LYRACFEDALDRGAETDERALFHRAAAPYQRPMPQQTYTELVDAFPRAHLVVGSVRQASRLEGAEVTIANLITALVPAGEWAVCQMRNGPGYAVHCVFARKDDADRLAAAVLAVSIGRYAGFASQRRFRLEEARPAITRVLQELARPKG